MYLIFAVERSHALYTIIDMTRGRTDLSPYPATLIRLLEFTRRPLQDTAGIAFHSFSSEFSIFRRYFEKYFNQQNCRIQYNLHIY